MSVVELQDCTCAARGCVRRSVFVFLSYSFREATKMVRKLEEDEAVGEIWDMLTRITDGRDDKVGTSQLPARE